MNVIKAITYGATAATVVLSVATIVNVVKTRTVMKETEKLLSAAG